MTSRKKNILLSIGFALLFGILVVQKSEEMDSISDLRYIIFTLILSAVLIIPSALFVLGAMERVTKDERWSSQYFDHDQSYSKSTVLEVYIRLGGAMLRKDQDNLKGKLVYLNRYFSKNFAVMYDEFAGLLRISSTHPIKLSTIAPWILKHIPEVTKRSQIIYFLAGLSTVDGSINPKEKAFLVELSDLIGLTKSEFNSIMAMYEKYEDAYEDQFKQRSAPSRSSSSYRLEKAYDIIGISMDSSEDELKKAYRELAKLHHPDRFATDGEGQQALAKERFVKMQQAYELIIESRNSR